MLTITPSDRHWRRRWSPPQCRGWPICRCGGWGAGGTDNVMYRLGLDRVLRFPRLVDAADRLRLEYRWLPVLAPYLPLAVPIPELLAEPGQGHPFPWAMMQWLPGRDAHADEGDEATADTLAAFILALRAVPVPPDAPQGRNVSLAQKDDFVRHMIAAFPDAAMRFRLTQFWDHNLAAPEPTGPRVWTHADLHGLNVLVSRSRISAVIDWGMVGACNGAADLICGWTLLSRPARQRLRQRLAADDAAWTRGRALAFAMAVQAIPYYLTSNPRFATSMQRTLDRVLADND